MKRFATLYAELDATTSINRKLEALTAYLDDAPDSDKIWAIALLSGRTPRRTVTATELREWAARHAGLPLWLFEESYAVVGDLAETIAHVLPEPEPGDSRSLDALMREIGALTGRDVAARERFVTQAWRQLAAGERLVFNKLITGGFRVGVSQKLMTRALARATGVEEAVVAERIMGDWRPGDTTFAALLSADTQGAAASRPYPFFLAHPLEADVETLGEPADWIAERKWDGIRGQLIRRAGCTFLWSRGEELVTDRFPEIAAAGDALPDGTVIDGEILPWRGDAPLSFQVLQTRIGRKTASRRVLADAPVVLMAYDLVERDGEDIRGRPLAERRAALADLAAHLPSPLALRLSAAVQFADWAALARVREASRAHGAEGLMLKRRDSVYGIGRRKGGWWKWKLDPFTIDAVMVYAQSGHGRRANLFTDLTFALWGGDGELVPFAKAYSGLTDAEFDELSRWVRRNTQERFGPVRRVTPFHVFEIGFEGLQRSGRHKSGLAVRFPRILRWRRDKTIASANRLRDLEALLDEINPAVTQQGGPAPHD